MSRRGEGRSWVGGKERKTKNTTRLLRQILEDCLGLWKEIEKNNGIEKSRDLFKKIKDIQGAFHAKMGTIKDRNGTDLTEAEDIKKKGQEYTELYKKHLHDPYNHDGVNTHLEPDILSVKSSGP